MAQRKWWQNAVFYQIYPRSFADGNGDGIGDLAGMIERLDYLQDLGVDGLWLSPHFPSPQYDCGYDVADYMAVAPEYGSLDDFRRFLEGAHQRHLRVILDLVLNHTSDQHPWFLESQSSLDNPKRDWYVWRAGVNGGPPNNWYSTFGGSAWEPDPRTGQYYYHFFLKQQPDLNWRNPEVKEAMWEAVRFWLRMGVDGFRLDAIDTIFEDPAMPNHRSRFTQAEMYRAWRLSDQKVGLSHYIEENEAMFQYQLQQPGLHELMRELRQVVDEFDDRLLVGESEEIAYCGDGTDELHMVFNFPLMRTERLSPEWVRANQEERFVDMPPSVWPCNTLNNHDSPRVYSRYGDGQHDDALARLHLALLLTLRGTPFLYNGEEIGMSDYLLSDITQFRDTVGVWLYNLEMEALGSTPQEALAYAAKATRDKCRTPLQWANAPHAGFSPAEVEPWLPVNPNYTTGVNVADQEPDPGSLLSYYRRLLQARKQTPALVDGDYEPVHTEAVDYLAFLRRSTTGRQVCLVVLNTSDRALAISFAGLETSGGRLSGPARLVFSSHVRPAGAEDLLDLRLAPYEAFIAEL